ncbi:hypothetical protein BVC80_1653g23 [Macleaya cordata]|uniref:Transmembrane protein n=1 Tax=Macleaya cordata TaxID=56857 RepID=A0A200PSP2_MACCD|nr:hypothetical protein BVC80_1653g23 [Macleaya cordata]
MSPAFAPHPPVFWPATIGIREDQLSEVPWWVWPILGALCLIAVLIFVFICRRLGRRTREQVPDVEAPAPREVELAPVISQPAEVDLQEAEEGIPSDGAESPPFIGLPFLQGR